MRSMILLITKRLLDSFHGWEDVGQNETDGSATVVIMTLGSASVTNATTSVTNHRTSATALDTSDTNRATGATVACLPSPRCLRYLHETKSSKSRESLESPGPSGLVLRYSDLVQKERITPMLIQNMFVSTKRSLIVCCRVCSYPNAMGHGRLKV